MITWFLLILLFFSTITIGVLGFYLYKFARIIMIFEDDISDTISALDNVDASLKNVINLKMFFDDVEIKTIVSETMETIKMARFNINKMSKRFTDRSKQKYIIIREDYEQEAEANVQQPLETFGNKKEGTLLHVGRNIE